MPPTDLPPPLETPVPAETPPRPPFLGYRSQAQRQKFQDLHALGLLSREVLDRWEAATPTDVTLPDRLHPKKSVPMPPAIVTETAKTAAIAAITDAVEHFFGKRAALITPPGMMEALKPKAIAKPMAMGIESPTMSPPELMGMAQQGSAMQSFGSPNARLGKGSTVPVGM